MGQTMKVQALTFSAFHGKNPPAGSTVIRVNQLYKYWLEFSPYRYGDKPDVILFQKVYPSADYDFPKTYPGIKILDICDSDWLEGVNVKQAVDAMHAVTCPTQPLAKFLRQLTDNPVVVIPDRYDLEDFPAPKEHTESAKTVLWFGYRHNIETLKPAMELIDKCGLNLLVIADDDPMPWQWLDRTTMEDFRYGRYKFIKHNADPKQLHLDMQEADFAILPKGTRPVDVFKSDNKPTRAILCSLPVAFTADEVRGLISPENRSKFMAERYEQTKKDFNILESIRQYRELIAELVAKNPRL